MRQRHLRRLARAAACVASLALLAYVAMRLVPCRALERFCARQNSSRLYDRDGELLYVLPLEDGLRREWYDLEQIPQAVVDAFVQAEDKHFFSHCGIDVRAVARAWRQNRASGRVVSGASTITMQLVRLVYPRKSARVTLGVKAGEAFRALWFEAKLTKSQILELYLNNVPFGYQTEGVGSAARSFFGCTPGQLTAEQVARLSTIPRRPAEYAPQKTYVYPSRCPHFVQYAISRYRQAGVTVPNDVTLSVRARWNEAAERLIQQKLDENADTRVHNGAAMVMDNDTGEILVWVGNASFDDKEHGGEIDGVLVANQPGSAMKPFLYALALERGFAPATVLADIPQDFGGEQVYVPLNFNNRYNGPVRMRVALASSLNIPAVYLLYCVGVDQYMERLSALGFASLDGTRGSTGLSLALGSSPVTLCELVRAFSVFARDGTVPTELSVTPGKSQPGTRAYRADTARVLCDMLSDPTARSLGFGYARVFDTPYPSIFKTGTSNQFQNIVALGSTTRLTAGVWMGNFEGQTVVRETGSSIPAGVVRALLDELTATYGADSFKKPQSYVLRPVCALSGMAATDLCPSVTQEYVPVANSGSMEPCTWHEASGGKVVVRYPSQYQHWAASPNIAGQVRGSGGELSFLYPRDRAQFVYDPTVPQNAQQLAVEVTGGTAPRATLYVDGLPVGETLGPFAWHIPLRPGAHTLTVECGGERQSIRYTVLGG